MVLEAHLRRVASMGPGFVSREWVQKRGSAEQWGDQLQWGPAS